MIYFSSDTYADFKNCIKTLKYEYNLNNNIEKPCYTPHNRHRVGNSAKD